MLKILVACAILTVVFFIIESLNQGYEDRAYGDQSNDELLKKIGWSYGISWGYSTENYDYYTLWKFYKTRFEVKVFNINTDKYELELSGSWEKVDEYNIIAKYDDVETPISFKFSDDYEKLVNDKGIEFIKID